MNHDSPPKSTRFRDFSEANAEQLGLNMENEFISCSPPHSNPIEYADYMVIKKTIMNKYFPIRHKTITQKRIHSPWITSDIMKYIRKNIDVLGL